MLEHTLPKSIRLEFSLPADLWLISADATQISQVLMNLCVNARDAMPHGGRLAVTAQNHTVDETYALMNPDAQPGPYVLLSVSDTGTGIPPEILERIFDPFFTTKKQGEGTGLGLSAVRGIVKSHGGFVSVYSEVGEGTRFSVYLPATTTTPGEQRAQEHTSLPRGQGELILVVDDELAICEITKATLEMHGYRALTAGDGAEALAALMENRREIKLVLTDMSMPVMDGAATIRALRKIEPRLLIVAATGLTGGGQSGAVQAGGVQAFLRKPYTAEKLLTILKEVLDQKSRAGYDSLQSTLS
jgi:CheY-like chemotaxis protein